jgi:hypothetical protein
MHYENTFLFIRNGVENLLNLDQKDFEVCLSWLCGYVSHMLADSIIHPVVNAIVGPYIFNQGEHRHCEMIQDSYIFEDIKGVEIRYADYVGLIKMCSDSKKENRINPAIKDFWSETLRMAHPGGKKKFNSIDPDDWHKNFIPIISKISDPISIFRHMGEEKNVVYKKTNEITKDERKRFIDEINLPGDKIGSFREDAFNKTVEKVVEVWHKLFSDIEKKNAEGCEAYIMNWNYDTGVDEDKIYFWA